MSFKSFRFLEDYNRRIIKEAEEGEDESAEQQDTEETTENSEESSETETPTPQEEQKSVEGNPETTPDVDEGIFISDIKKTEWTKLMLQALMTAKPEPGDFNEDLLNVNTENVNNVISEIKNYIKLKSTENDLDSALSGMI